MSRKQIMSITVCCFPLWLGGACGAPPNGPETTTNVSGTDGVLDPEPGECFFAESPGVVGERYQCQGYLDAVFGADPLIGNEPVSGAYGFAFGYTDSPDSYEKPYVEACCLPKVAPTACPGGPSNQHKWACYVDAIQQMCLSLGTKVQDNRESAPLFLRPSLDSLRDWLNEAASIDECATTFITNTGLEQFDCAQDPSEQLENVTWYPSQTTFGLLENPYWRIAHMVIEGAYKPKSGVECVDNHENDRNLPTEMSREGDISLRLAGGSTTLTGPDVMAEANLSSMATGCLGRNCSFATIDFSDTPGAWSLAGLQFQSVGSSTAGNGNIIVEVEEYTISLFSPVTGTVQLDIYEVPPAAALFTISGATSFGDYVFSASNTSSIVFHPKNDGWFMESFEIGFTDLNGDDWSLLINAATWAFEDELVE